MTEEQRHLLIKDLCGRLPYGVNILHVKEDIIGVLSNINIYVEGREQKLKCVTSFYVDDKVPIEEFKPYLYPLSSMTEEQEEEFNALFYRYHESAFIFNERFSYDRCSIKDIGFYPCYLQDWLNKNHFDYRGLIPMGLAIDATGIIMYDKEE